VSFNLCQHESFAISEQGLEHGTFPWYAWLVRTTAFCSHTWVMDERKLYTLPLKIPYPDFQSFRNGFMVLDDNPPVR